MNLDDESYLSAYLDDELDPAERQAVEWSVESSPPRADQIRSIAQVREAVAGLDRPAIPRDLGPALAARIARNHRLAPPPLFLRPARLARVASAFVGFATVAASLIFAVVRLYQPLHESPEVPVVASNEIDSTHRNHPIEPSRIVEIPASTSLPLLARDSTPSALELVHEAVASPPPVPDAIELPGSRDERRLVGDMLARTHVRRVLIVTDVIDAPDRVRRLIAESGREASEFGRISIRQELVIDPEHAEAAEVFAVPIDERGRRALVDRLQKHFSDLVEEGPSSPELVTQLSEVGQVAVFKGLKAAPLGDPPGDIPGLIAHRETDPLPGIFEANRTRLVGSKVVAKNTGVGVWPDGIEEGADAFVGPLDPRRKPPPRPGDRVTLLVWVTHPSLR
jgi:hypothetical protein